MKDIVAKIKISPKTSIKEALKKIDEAGWAILFVCDEKGRLLGSLSDGDIRRRILKTGSLKEKITDCFNHNPVFVVRGSYTNSTIRSLMLEKTVAVLPVVDKQKVVVDVLLWKDIFDEEAVSYKKISVPVIIMAGGKGERMGPFTKILPKPLIPVGEKPVIEIIIDKFNQYGVKHFYITLNYKGKMIKAYFESIERKYKISYIWEKEFLGTAGSLKLISSSLENTFMVSNCDVIVDADYENLLSFHQKNKNILTVVGSIHHHRIPYGVIHFEKEGKIKKMVEKPEFDFTINTGMYVLSKKALEFIPKNKCFDMTDLIQVLLKNKENIGVYPVSQKSYVDIGQWEEYKKTVEKLQVFK